MKTLLITLLLIFGMKSYGQGSILKDSKPITQQWLDSAIKAGGVLSLYKGNNIGIGYGNHDTIPCIMLVCDTSVSIKAGYAEWTIGYYSDEPRTWKTIYFGQTKQRLTDNFVVWMAFRRKQP